MAWTQNLLGLCLFGCAPDAAFLGFAWWLKFRSGNVSRFLRLHSCNGLDAKPAGALPFRMRSRRSFLRLCLVADVSQWLRHVFIVFMGHDFINFTGSKGNVSRFLRLHSCNGLDAKPAGALPLRMRSRRSFLTLCLVADPRSGWGTFSLRLHSCNGLDAKPAGALPFRMRSRRSFFVPEFVVLRWLRRSPTFFLGFAWWLKFRSGLGMLSLFFFGGFQKQRVGIFLAVLSYGLGVFRGSKSNAVAEAGFHCFYGARFHCI